MGPSCGLILADLGAEVVKIEPAPGGDKTRGLRGSGAGFFPTYNRNKYSVAIDLKSEKGQEVARRLISTADVLIENFRPGAMDKMGLGYEALRHQNEGLIYCSLKGFLPGPYQDRTALDEVVQMMGGLAYMTGPPGRPLRAGASVNDIMGGMFGAIAVLAALAERAKTGKGQLVRSALYENNIFLVAQHMVQFMVSGIPTPPLPNRVAAWAVYDLFETQCGEQIFVGVVSDTQWRHFCQAFHIKALEDDPDLATNEQRVAARDRILPVIRDLFGRLTKSQAMHKCEQIGLPYAPINRPEDLYEDPQINRPEGTTELTLSSGQTVKVPTLPIEMKGKRLGKRMDLPRMGEHSEYILKEAGYSDNDIKKLVNSNIVGIFKYNFSAVI